MSAKEEDFTVVCAWIPEGINEEVAGIIDGKANAFGPDARQLFQPDTCLYFFRDKKNGAERAKTAVSLLHGARGEHPRLSAMRLGSASGPLIADISWLGAVNSMPVGRAVTEAQKQARASNRGG